MYCSPVIASSFCGHESEMNTATSQNDREQGEQEAAAVEGKKRNPALYCGDFDPNLKERCERIAGYLHKSISEFVAEILEDETLELKEHLAAIDRWYAARQKKKEKRR
jgi:hypothetical protein